MKTRIGSGRIGRVRLVVARAVGGRNILYATDQHVSVGGQTERSVIVNEGFMGRLVTKTLAKEEKPATID